MSSITLSILLWPFLRMLWLRLLDKVLMLGVILINIRFFTIGELCIVHCHDEKMANYCVSSVHIGQ